MLYISVCPRSLLIDLRFGWRYLLVRISSLLFKGGVLVIILFFVKRWWVRKIELYVEMNLTRLMILSTCISLWVFCWLFGSLWCLLIGFEAALFLLCSYQLLLINLCKVSSPEKGVAFEDPLFIYLFSMALEMLSLLLNKLSWDFGFHPTCERIQLDNLCFSNDLMIFSSGDKCVLSFVKESLTYFEFIVGFVTNLRKSSLFWVGHRRWKRLVLLWGLTLPPYLGST